MRPSAGNSGQYDSNRSLNKPRVADHNAYLPMRSSAQVFAQQNAQDSSLKRTSTSNSQNFSSSSVAGTKRGYSFNQDSFTPRTQRAEHRLNSNQTFSCSQDSSGTRKQRSISPTGALPFNPNAGANRYQGDRFFPEATASRYDAPYERSASYETTAPYESMHHEYDATYGNELYESVPYGSQELGSQGYGSQRFGSQGFSSRGYDPQGYGPQEFGSREYGSQGFSPQAYESQGYGPQGAYAYSDSYGAPSAAVAIPRPARIPAGYLPYTQTSKMGKGEQASNASETSTSFHRSQPPITSLDDDFPAGSGGSALAPNVYPPDFDQNVAGAGAGTGASPLDKKRKADDPQKDRFRKNLKYGEYLSVPQGKKAIFTDNGGTHAKTLLWMGIILVVLLVAAIAVWSFV